MPSALAGGIFFPTRIFGIWGEHSRVFCYDTPKNGSFQPTTVFCFESRKTALPENGEFPSSARADGILSCFFPRRDD